MSFFVKNKNKSTLDSRRKDKTDDLAGPDYNNETKGITRGLVLDLFHIPTGESVNFKAFLTTYSDQYNSSWESTEVFGRMDPIQTFKNTKRVISLGWDVVASSVEEAIINLDKCQRLFSMLYPVYETHDDTIPGSTTMVASPLFKLKFVNLIQNVGTGAEKLKAEKEIKNLQNQDIGLNEELKDIEAEMDILLKEQADAQQSLPPGPALDAAIENNNDLSAEIDKLQRKKDKLLSGRTSVASEIQTQQGRVSNFKSVTSGNSRASINGLVGTVSGFTYEPDIEVGFFSDGIGGELYPQTIKLACEYTVLHTHKLGWDSKDGAKRSPQFPYKANI